MLILTAKKVDIPTTMIQVDYLKEEQKEKNAEEKRKNYFKTIGKKGGLAKKKSALFSKTISTKLTEKELQEIQGGDKRLTYFITNLFPKRKK